MKPVNTSAEQTFSSFNTEKQTDLVSASPKAGLLQFFPLSLPLTKQLFSCLSNLMPSREKHKAMLSVLMDDDQGKGVKAIQQVLHECVESSSDTLEAVNSEDFKQLMNTPITAQLQIQSRLQHLTDGQSEFTHQGSLKEFLDIFQPEHIEVTGSTAKSLLAGKGVPSKSSDLDLVIYVDLQKFGKNPQERNWAILNSFADHCGYPKEAAVRSKATIGFLNHAFGCTFKPAVDLFSSHIIEITLIDSKLYPMNKTGPMNKHYPRWDQIQSSLKILSHDGFSAKAEGLLSINALKHLEKRGLVLFNPLINTEGALTRIAKATGPKFQNLAVEHKLFRLQPQLVDTIYRKSDAYDKHQFQMQSGSLEQIPVLSFSELLDEHAEIYHAHHTGTLSLQDVQILEICLAEVAYKALKNKPEERHELNQQVYRAQCATAAGKTALAQKHLHSILSHKINIARLHPMSQIWLEGLVTNTDFEKPLNSQKLLNWLDFAQKSPTHSVEDALKLIDTTKGKGKKEKPAVSRDDIRKSLAAIQDAQKSCRALIALLERYPNDQASLQQLFVKLSRMDLKNSAEFEPFIDSLPMKSIQEPKTLLALLDLSLSDKRHIQSDQWNQKLKESVSGILAYTYSRKDFAEFNRILKQHLGDHIYPGAVADILQESSGFEDFVLLIMEKSPATESLPGLQFILGQSLMKRLDHDKVYSDGQNKQALDYFELAAASGKHALDSVNAALMVCQKMGDAEKGLDVIARFMNKLTDAEKQDSVFLDSAREMISMMGSLDSKHSPETLKCFKQLEPLLGDLDRHEHFEHYGKGLMQLYHQYTFHHRHILTIPVLEHFNERIKSLLDKTAVSADDKKTIENNANRTLGYLVKRQADLMLTMPDFESKENYQILIGLYSKAAVLFEKIDEDFAEDYIHLSELAYSLHVHEEALNAVKTGFELDSRYMTNYLSEIILALNNEKQIFEAIDYFKKEIVKANIKNQPVNYTLFLQLLAAMKGGKDNQYNFAQRNESMVVKFLSMCQNTKFMDNLHHCNATEDKQFNQLQNSIFDSLRWGLQASVDAFKESNSSKFELLGFALQLDSLNKFINLEGKLKTIAQTKLNNLDQGTLICAITLRQLVKSQGFILFAASKNEKFKEIFANNHLVDQVRDYGKIVSAIVQNLNIFSKEERHDDLMLKSLSITLQTSMVLNNLSITDEAVIGLLNNLIENGHEWHATLDLDLKKKNLPKGAVMNAIEDVHGQYTKSYLSMSAENMFLLGLLVDQSIPEDGLQKVSQHINSEHFKALQEHTFKMFDQLESNIRQKKPYNHEHAEIYLKAFVLRGISHFESKDSGLLFVKYKHSLYNSVFALQHLDLNYMKKFSAMILRSKPDIPSSLEADVKRLLK